MYDASEIVVLEGLKAVRLRPAMYIDTPWLKEHLQGLPLDDIGCVHLW